VSWGRDGPPGRLKALVEKYWKPGLYERRYVDRSADDPTEALDRQDVSDIYRAMHKYSDADIYNCNACGYKSCEAMAKAISLGLNRPENCHHFTLHQSNEERDRFEREKVETASILSRIGASADDIDRKARQNAETTNRANSLVKTAKAAADSGAERMEILGASMAAITESSEKISRILETIDNVAFRTNILALNAAVEAAHAGQHGKGFAVVAEEVRNLAAHSAAAAQETATLIEESISRIGDGNRAAKDTARALADIVGKMVEIDGLVGALTTSGNEQAHGIAEINAATKQ
jgi:methyl-accepting chemotaxis protein